MADLFLPEIGEATFVLLRRLGLDPIYHEEQTCCGQPLFNAGYKKRAKETAKHFIEVFGEDDAIICPSGSCVHMVKHSYPALMSDESHWAGRAQQLAQRVFELSQYIVDELGVEDVGAAFKGKVTYHESCRLFRGLGVSEQPRKLLRSCRGTELVEMDKPKKCCGFGGGFANDYPEISEAMVEEKAADYLESGADVLIACEPGCLLNISGYLNRNHPGKRVMHLATFLASASGDNRL